MKDIRNVSGRLYCSKECKHEYLSKHTGGYRKGSGCGKKGWYKGIYCDSSWELAYVIYNKDKDIQIERCKEIRKYVYNGEEYSYHPDFIVDGKIIKIKGYNSEQWQAKQKYNPDIKVFYEEDMKVYLKYVHDKYGNDFINMYDDSNPKNDLSNRESLWLHNQKYNIYVSVAESKFFIDKGWIKGRIAGKISKEIIEDFLKNYDKSKCFEILGIKTARLNRLIKEFCL